MNSIVKPDAIFNSQHRKITANKTDGNITVDR